MNRKAIALVLCLLPPAVAAAQPSLKAMAYLTQALRDPKRSAKALTALRAAWDKDLTPLFVALTSNSNVKYRRFAVAALAGQDTPEVRAALLDRVRGDPDMLIRAEALVRLLNMKAIETKDIREALDTPDERIQCLAARGLVARKAGHLAVGTFKKLAASKTPEMAAMARLGLLATGDEAQLAALRALLADKDTTPATRELLMGQITRDKITPALPLARLVAASDAADRIRLLAYEAVSTASPNDPSDLIEAIHATGSVPFRVQLLEVLAGRRDAREHLEKLAAVKGPIGLLCRFELARPARDATTRVAAKAAAETGHPIVMAYMLSKARKDIDENPKRAACYVPALLACVRSIDPLAEQIGAEHYRATRATAMLLDIGTPEAMGPLREILAGRFNMMTRSVAAGLFDTENPAVCELARPLLDSAYPELAWRGAMTLGKFARSAAQDFLADIVDNRATYRTEKVALASWFLLKIDKVAKSTVAELARRIK